MVSTHHRSTIVDGRGVFYREAGEQNALTVVLLHGFPTSSAMYRGLIPLLAQRYHVVAPDHIGFGLSETPSIDDFSYTFDSLADVTERFLAQLGVDRFAVVVQDYGAPVAWRLLLRSPERVTAVVSQNGNAYEEGFVESFWAPIWRYAAHRGTAEEADVRGALRVDAIRWQYVHGLDDPSVVDPDLWLRDSAQVARPGVPEAQLALFADYGSNRELYPQVHESFRRHPVPLLAVWGERDEIFGPDGARAFRQDLPAARVELLPGGHFLLESHLDEVAGCILDFLGEALADDDA